MTTDLEVRMTIKTLAGRHLPNREIASQLDMTEGNAPYHLGWIAQAGRQAPPGRRPFGIC